MKNSQLLYVIVVSFSIIKLKIFTLVLRDGLFLEFLKLRFVQIFRDREPEFMRDNFEMVRSLTKE